MGSSLRSLASVMSLVLLSGCLVPKKKYDALDATLQEARATHAQVLQEQRSSLEQSEATIVELRGEVESTKDAIAAKQAELDETHVQMAGLDAELARAREKTSKILKDRGALRGEVTAMKQALAELEKRQQKAEARVHAYQDLVKRFSSLIEAGALEVKMIEGRMVVVLATDVLFASGSADLSKDGKGAIAEVATILATIDERHFQVEGHTDADPINNQRFPNNWYLAAARAIGVVEHMIASGMPTERISAGSYGAFHPVDSNRTKEGKAHNRRIEIVVVPDLSDLPGYEELGGL